MIGMMNVGAQDSVDFFGSARQTSLYDNRKVSRDLRTYMADGRVMLNGIPVNSESPEELWQNLIHKVVAKNMVDGVVEKPGKIASILRRLSSKFSSFSKNRADKKEEDDVVELADEDEAFHITRIRILTQMAEKENPQAVEDRNIANRVKQAQIERNNWHSNSKETDSGRVVCMEDAPATNHRVVIAVDRP